MKKYVAMVLVLVLILTATACSNNNHALSQIYEVDSGSLSGEYNHDMNVLPFQIDSIQEDLVGKTMTFQTDTKTYSLIYDVTIFYPDSDLKVHKYKINGSEYGEICFKEDGSVYKFLDFDEQICILDIEPTDTAEMVHTALAPAISDFVDVSKYENWSVISSPGVDNMFGQYMFYYYNMVQGYYADQTFVIVEDDGRVRMIGIDDIDFDTSSIGTISKDRENELLQERIKSICSTSGLQYISYEIADAPCTPYFRYCGGELCIKYVISCKAYDADTEENTSFSSTLLIPVRLLTES